MRGDHLLARIPLPGSARQLALLRLAVGTHIFLFGLSHVWDYMVVTGTHAGKLKTLVPRVAEKLIEAHLVGFATVTSAVALLVALGLFTRVATWALLICFVLLCDIYYRHTDFVVIWQYHTFTLLVLSLSRCADVWSMDAFIRRWRRHAAPASSPTDYRWPVELMTLWFSLVYFAAGLAKVFPLRKGAVWIEGSTARKMAVDRFLDSPMYWLFGEPLFNYTAASWFWLGSGMGTLVVELGAILLLFTRRFHAPVVVAILGFHVTLYLLGVSGFLPTVLVSLIYLLPPALFGDVPSRESA